MDYFISGWKALEHDSLYILSENLVENLATTCSDRMMGVEGATEINLKPALDMSTKHGLL